MIEAVGVPSARSRTRADHTRCSSSKSPDFSQQSDLTEIGIALANRAYALLETEASNRHRILPPYCVAVAQDPAGNLKPAKDKSTERIDGIVALIMAIGRAMVAQDEPQPEYSMFFV